MRVGLRFSETSRLACLYLGHFETGLQNLFIALEGLQWGIVVSDTQSDSIQYLIFAKKDSFNIQFNIALPKIQFKLLFDSKNIC